MRKLIYTLLTFLSLALNVESKSVHWISIFDTDDVHVGTYNTNSLDLLNKHIVIPFSSVLDSLGFENYIYRIDGNNLTTENLVNTIKSIECTPEDLIFTYYCGHGNATPDPDRSELPVLYLDKTYDIGLPLSYLQELIESKGAKANIITTVASNLESAIPMPNLGYLDSILNSPNNTSSISPIKLSKERFVDTHLTDNKTSYINDLISELYGTTVLLSAKRGFSSYCFDSDLGATDYFTYALIRDLEMDASENEKVELLSLLNELRTIVSELTDNKQVPAYIISYKR